MRYVIHGEDLISSRNCLSSLKKRYSNVVNLDGGKLSVRDLDEAISNSTLFTGKSVVVIENYPLPEKIPSLDSLSDLVFWWSRNLLNVPKADKVFHFKSQSAFGIFRFADSIGQKQAKSALPLLNKLLEERASAEKIIAMLTRQLKMIAQVLDGSADKVSKSQFVQKKLVSQAARWDFKKIQEGLSALFQTDLKIKQGKIKQHAALTFLIYRLCE